MAELLEQDLFTLAGAVRDGEVSAETVAEEAVAAAQADSVGAFVRVDAEGALAAACAIDQRRAQGEPLGALAGVPVGLKDNLSMAGRPLGCGSRILDGYTAPYNATAVQRLVDQDAVVVGQTNMDEFAMGSSCENSAVQETRNPWDSGRVPGGSSGGSAAAVAAGQVPLTLGSDTGGSIRQPASFCGVVGLKPSYGRVSRWGLVAFASSLDQIGPMTRSVPEAALAYRCLAGHDPLDSTSANEPVEDPLAGCSGPGDLADRAEGLRIGWLSEIDEAEMPVDVRANWDAARAQLEGAGLALQEVQLPSLSAAIAIYYVLANCEASANLARFDGVRYGRRTEAPGSLRALHTGSRSEGFGPEVKRRIMLGTFALSSGYYDAYYGRAAAVARRLRLEFRELFEQVDVVITPTSPSAAFGIGERVDDPLQMYLADVFTTPANLCGLPAISVPSGRDGDGLPLGLQFLARTFDEVTLLRAAAAFEQTTDWGRRIAGGS